MTENEKNESKMLDMCIDCTKVDETGKCMIYSAPPSFYIRNGECGMNMKLVDESAKQKKVRVGQQKQKGHI